MNKFFRVAVSGFLISAFMTCCACKNDMSRFQGTWELASFTFDGKPFNPPPAFHDSFGRLIYTSNGQMSVHILWQGRTNYPGTGTMMDQLRAKPEDTKQANDSYSGYFGSYVLDETKKTVTHKIKGSFFPNWTGIDETRNYKFSDNDNTLVLSFDTAVLTWKRTAP